MNAWRVKLNDCDTVILLADTPGAATAGAIREAQDWGAEDDWDTLDWKRVRRWRLPDLDGETITERQLLEGRHMGWSECPCGARILPAGVDGQPPVYDDQGRAYCSDGCRERPSPTWTGQSTVWFLSTEY